MAQQNGNGEEDATREADFACKKLFDSYPFASVNTQGGRQSERKHDQPNISNSEGVEDNPAHDFVYFWSHF